MDMYEITLNVMYAATVFFIAFTVVMWVFNMNTAPKIMRRVVYLGWFISVAVWLASMTTLIWVK